MNWFQRIETRLDNLTEQVKVDHQQLLAGLSTHRDSVSMALRTHRVELEAVQAAMTVMQAALTAMHSSLIATHTTLAAVQTGMAAHDDLIRDHCAKTEQRFTELSATVKDLAKRVEDNPPAA